MTSPCMLFIILLGLGLGTSVATISSQSAPVNTYEELEQSLREIGRGDLSSQEKEIRLAILKARFEDAMSLKNENFNKQQGKENSNSSADHSIQNNNFKQGNDNSSSTPTTTGHLIRSAGRHVPDDFATILVLFLLVLSVIFMPVYLKQQRPLKHKLRK